MKTEKTELASISRATVGLIPPFSLCSASPDRSHDYTSRAFFFFPSRVGGKKVSVNQTARPHVSQQPLNPAALRAKASATVGD